MSENTGPVGSRQESGLLVSHIVRDGTLNKARGQAKRLLKTIQSTRVISVPDSGWLTHPGLRRRAAELEAEISEVPEAPLEWEAYRRAEVEALGEDATLFPLDPSRILLAGDWHGEPIEALSALYLAKKLRCEVVAQLGDFGVWPGKGGQRYLDVIARGVEETGIPVFFIDGNHEAFDQLERFPILPSGWRPLRKGVVHAPRGQRWSWLGKTWAALGGAFSIDFESRMTGVSWWPEELISMGDLYRLGTDPVDVLLTHDAPSAYQHPGMLRPHIAEQANAHRKNIDHALEVTGADLLFHGHFHRAHRSTFFWPNAEGIDVHRTRYGLGMNDQGEDCYLVIERADEQQ